MTVEELNTLGDTDAADAFRACCGSSTWVEAMLAERPFASSDSLFSKADEIWSKCGPDDWHEAFSHHPRIGASASGKEAVEQSGAQSATRSLKDQLADVNRRYEERFGHIFIVCATGKTAEEMLGIAISRLHNDPDTELRIAAREQRKIMQLRLRKLLS